MKKEKPDLLDAISLLAREKDIDEAILIDTIEDALKVAYRRNNRTSPLAHQNLTVRLSRKQGVEVLARKVVVDDVEDVETQISL